MLLKNIKAFYHNQNTQQYIDLLYGFIPEVISIVISNLALLFIPQTQDYSYNTISSWNTLNTSYKFLFILNIICLIFYLILYYIEIHREIWLIKTFDYSKRYNSVHLVKYKKDYPELFSTLTSINNRYYISYAFIKYIFIINLITSCIIIIYFGYNGYQTISTLFMNFWISFYKVKKGLNVSKNSLNMNMGYSYFNMQHLSFNRIDSKLKKHISNSNICDFNGGETLSLPTSRLHSRKNSLNNTKDIMNESNNNDNSNSDNNHIIIPIPIINIPTIHVEEFEIIDHPL